MSFASALGPARALRYWPFTAPLSAYGLSAVIGALIAYNAAGSLRKLLLVGSGLLVYTVLAMMPARLHRDDRIPLLRTLVATMPAFIAAYFLLTHGWTQPGDKVPWLDPFHVWVSQLLPHVALPPLQPNVVGGLLAMMLPLQAAALARRDQRAPDFMKVEGAPRLLLLGLTAAGLLLSSLRGAWLALGAAVGLVGLARLVRSFSSRRGVARTLVAGAVIAGGAMLVWGGWGATWMASRPDRLIVWQNSWHLGRDYVFTGLGLGAFTMAYSSYALLVHTPHTTHAHNLFLDLWLEQGLLGVAAFVCLVGVALASPSPASVSRTAVLRGEASRWRSAAVVSLLVIVIHGFVDDVYYGYGGTGIPLLLVPVALLARGLPPLRLAMPSLASKPRLAAIGVAVFLALGAVVSPTSRAMWNANVAALLQTRHELALYVWPKWPLQDAVRRSDASGLDNATRRFRRALALDPDNAQANRRLGQIELSLGQYDQARLHLESAYRVTPTHQATRQLFGESLAVTGDPSSAAQYWRGLPVGENQLAIRQWWYTNLEDEQRAHWVNDAIALAHPGPGPTGIRPNSPPDAAPATSRPTEQSPRGRETRVPTQASP